MIHGLKSELGGQLPTLTNDLAELKRIEKVYIKALAKETSMTKRQLKKMLERKVNIYLSAEEAVELGIADIIV